MKRRVVQALIASMVMSALIITPLSAAPTVEELEADKAAAESEVSSLQEELSALITKMQDLEKKLNKKNEEIVQAGEDLEAAEEKEKQQYEDMKLRIQYMYEGGDASALEKFISAGSISEALSQIEYVEKIHTYDRDQLDEYKETVEEVETLKTTLEEEQKQLESLKSDLETEEQTLNTTIQEKSDEVENLDGMLKEAAEKALAEQQRAAEEQAAQAGGSGGSSDSGGSSSGGGGGSYNPPEYNVVTGNAIVDRAYQWVGKAEYVWGACSPGAFDCSGFVAYCLTGNYQRLGTTATFMGWPQVSNPQPGDVCVIHEEYGSQHTGIYIGNGQMIHAATFGVGVIIGPVQSGMIYVRY